MPNDPLKGFNTANTGDLPGAWGTVVVNQNFTVVGGYLGGVASVSLTNANVSLSIGTGSLGTGSITPGAGPVQAANAVLRFAGTLTGNCTITFPCPGYWIVENNCGAATSFYVALRATGTGNLVTAPPGETRHVYNDGTDCKYVNMGSVGQLLDLCVGTTPVWMSGCTVAPYLACVGTATYSVTTYPALGAILGSTWGGNGITTFGVPDLANRARVSIDTVGAGRLTFAGSAITGTLLGAVGGAQNVVISTSNLPASIPYTDSGHVHADNVNPFKTGSFAIGNGGPPTGYANNSGSQLTWNTANATTNITINPGSPNTAALNVQPSIVFGVTFIKT